MTLDTPEIGQMETVGDQANLVAADHGPELSAARHPARNADSASSMPEAMPNAGVATLTEDDVQALSLTDLYSRFESLGNNCEFGIVQRSAGYDPPGLFRNVGFLDVEQIINAVTHDFEGMFEEGRYELTAPDGWLDWRLDCQVFGFMFHTGIALTIERGSREWDKHVSDMLPVFAFLKQKLQEDLSTGRKMFIFRSLQDVPATSPRRLLNALQLHGRNSLLYVRQDASRPTGTLRFEGDGLVEATLSRLSNENPPRIEFSTWERMARKLVASQADIWNAHGEVALAPIVGAEPIHTPVSVVPEPPQLVQSMPVRHEFGTSTLAHHVVVSFDIEDLPGGTIITAQTWVWLPSTYVFEKLDFILIGYATEGAILPYLSNHDSWQLISVTARVPPDGSRAVPALHVQGATPGHFFSAGWSFRLGAAPES